MSQRQEDEAESATPAEVPELIGARASSTHRGRVRGLSRGEKGRTVLHGDVVVRLYHRE